MKSHGSLQALQQHYHPEVSKAASAINQALSVPEVSIAPLLEVTAFEVRACGGAAVERVGGRGGGVAVKAQCRLTVHPFLADLRAGPEEEGARVGAAGVRPSAGPAGPAGGPLCPALHAELTLCTLLPTTPRKWLHGRAVRVGWRVGSRGAHPVPVPVGLGSGPAACPHDCGVLLASLERATQGPSILCSLVGTQAGFMQGRIQEQSLPPGAVTSMQVHPSSPSTP